MRHAGANQRPHLRGSCLGWNCRASGGWGPWPPYDRACWVQAGQEEERTLWQKWGWEVAQIFVEDNLHRVQSCGEPDRRAQPQRESGLLRTACLTEGLHRGVPGSALQQLHLLKNGQNHDPASVLHCIGQILKGLAVAGEAPCAVTKSRLPSVVTRARRRPEVNHPASETTAHWPHSALWVSPSRTVLSRCRPSRPPAPTSERPAPPRAIAKK